MLSISPVIRFSQSIAVLLTVVALIGCQCFAPKSAPTTPLTPPVIHPPNIESVHHEVFRPIMPEPLPAPFSVLERPAIEPSPVIEPPPASADLSNSTQSKIDELSQRISELEAQLEEARQTPPPVNLLELPLPAVSSVEKTKARVMRNLPIINRQGVNVYADESQQARIDMTDLVLFMPNSWQLSADGEETLRVIAAELRAFDPQSVLDIEGHTDSLMGDPNNPMQKHEISSVKTKIVMDFFVNSLHWDAARIGTSSFGRSRPIMENGTPEGRARNNRIEIVIREGNE